MSVSFVPDRQLYPFESRWFDSSAGRVHYVDEGQGRPLLLLHGNPTWSFLYRGVIARLRDRFRCIAPDYPGFGLSDRPHGYGYTPGEHARVVEALVAHLKLEDAIVFGQDWGGPIGIATACADPRRFTGLVFGNTWFWPMQRLVGRAFSRVMSTRLLQWWILERNGFVERLLPAGTARRLSRTEMDHYRGVQPHAAARRGVAELPRQIVAAGPWLAELAATVPDALADKPLLLLWGMRDPVFPPSLMERWTATFPDHEIRLLAGAKHFIQEDAPGDISAAILSRFG